MFIPRHKVTTGSHQASGDKRMDAVLLLLLREKLLG